MNFLAHLLLSGPAPDLLIGNFVADMLYPSDRGLDQPFLYKGILLHRRIDHFTDAHPMIAECRALLRPVTGKYAPVVMDIFMDFLLSDHWEQYARMPFSDFEEEVYRILAHNLAQLPGRLHPSVRQMISHAWLRTYATTAGREDVFRRVQKRVSRPELLRDVLLIYEGHYPALSKGFQCFFPEMIEEVAITTKLPNPWINPQSGRRSLLTGI